MNLKEMRAMLRSNLDDLNGEIHTNDACRLFLNSGFRHVWSELLKQGIYLKKRNIDITFTPTTQEVLIEDPNNIAKIILVEDEDKIPIDIVEEEYAKRSDTRAVYISRRLTTVGVLVGNKRYDYLGWYREPDSTIVVTLTVCDKINEFSSSDSDNTEYNDIPSEYHDVVITWATILALARLEEPADYWVNLYQVQMDDLIQTVGFINREAKGVIDV